MDSRWFKEDRALPKNEQAEAKIATETALRNSTLMHRRLVTILEEMEARLLKNDEEVENPAWERIILANIGARKTIHEIQTLLHF